MRYLPSLLSISFFTVVLAAPVTSHRAGNATFREEIDGLSVFAGGYPASMGANDAYVPVPVALALMRPGTSIAFTPESFTLTDAQGNRFPAAGFLEVKNGYSKLDFDRSLMQTWPVQVGQNITDRPRIASNFYPPTGSGTRIARVELAPFSWFSDVIYFPRPPAGLSGVMTLTVAIGDGNPVDLRLLMDSGALAR